ncbi:MAG: PIN domain-containing protein [Nitrospirae bacterium]|nr:PIN domain-containing protein [Nitrospirota bacterium]
MTYVVDTHILIWFLDKNKRLDPRHYQILIDKNNNFVLPAIVLAEIKHLISLKRITVGFDEVIGYLGESDNCIIYPVDEDVVEKMPEGLNIHDALIVATGLVYKNILSEDVILLTEDEEIIKAAVLPVV